MTPGGPSGPGARRSESLAEASGIHRIPVPTPFLVGRINCYLIEDSPLTLIDTGPNSGKSLDELELALRGLGHTIEDLELIIITHQHMDHLGLVEILARRSGAEAAALDLLAPYLENFKAAATADDEFATEIMTRHGVPADVITALSSVGASFRAFGSSAQVSHRLRDGEDLRPAGRTLRVLHRPGHSPSDTVFWDRERAMLLAGDHLLAHISSNPLVSRPLADDGGRADVEQRGRHSGLPDHLRGARTHGPPALPRSGARRRAGRVEPLSGRRPLSSRPIRAPADRENPADRGFLRTRTRAQRPMLGVDMSSRPQKTGGTRVLPVSAAALSSDLGRAYPRGLLQRVPAILYTAEPGAEGVWRYVRPQIEGILGFTAEEWCADPHLWAQRLHPEDLERVLQTESAIIGGNPSRGAAEYRLLHRDGRIVRVRDDALLLTDEDGEHVWHGVMSDITEQKEAEAELARRAAQQSAVARLGQHALEDASISDLMNEALAAAAQLVEVEIGCVLELVPEREIFVIRNLYGLDSVARTAQDVVPADDSSQAGYTVLNGRPVVVEDWAHEDRFPVSPLLRKGKVRSGLSVVIEGRRGPFGVLGLHSRSLRSFTAGDIDFVQSLANVLGDTFERQLTDDDIRHRALHDTLTGLPNRLLFLDRLEHALERLRRRRSMSAILILDLDRFKLVNDSMGHKVGDELLAGAAPRLKQAVRSSDTVARFGGDEFGILLEEIAGENDAIEMAQRIASVFTRPFVLDGNEHFVTTSIGISIAEGGELAEDLIRDADAAMNRAKERGRARYELFDEGLRGRAISRLRVENDLRRALERDELRLDYQPLVSLRDRRIIGVEALIRWDHPTRGVVAPADFIPVAEENGLIEPIGRWVLDHACRQGARWYRERPDSPPISIAVNLSAVQVASRGLPDTVAAALRASGLDPSCLILEITESIMLADAEGLTETLQALKAIGVRLVLDDFGTGYSSLSYLTRLPLDALKVDRSFIDGLGTEPRDTTVTEAIVAMAHALSLQVVGEGAETAVQIAELNRLGCDLVQGFFFSRPVPAAEITSMLECGAPWLADAPVHARGR